MNITPVVFLYFLVSLFSYPDDSSDGPRCRDRYESDERGVTYDCISIAGADAETFTLLTHDYGYFAKDRFRVYCRGKPLAGVAPGDFALLTYQFATDGRRIFNKCETLAGANPRTFTVFPTFLGSGYARDENNVYYDGGPIAGADPGSFILLDFGHAKDVVNVYKNGEIFDPVKVRQSGEWVNLGEPFPYSKTAFAVYYKGRPLPGADPASFEEEPAAPYGVDADIARDKNALWVGGISHPFTGPGRQIGSPSGSNMPSWILGKKQLAYLNVDETGAFVIEITDVDAGKLRMFPYAAYATDGEKVIHRGKELKEADAETFGVFSGVLGNFFSNGSAQFAYDRNHLYREEKPIFTFDGTARLIWPSVDDEGRSPDWSVEVALFGNGHSLWLARYDRNSASGGMTCVPMPVAATGYRMIAPIRNQPSDPVAALIGTDGLRVFYNDTVLEGIDPAGLRMFETSYRRGAVSDNALIIEGYRNLVVRNAKNGDRHVVGKDGWHYVRFIDRDGRPDRAEFFDGRIHVDIERDMRVWEEGETPGDSVWEATRQQ